MSLRRRLVAAFILLLVVALSALSLIATRSTTRVLLDQADSDLRAIESRFGDQTREGSRKPDEEAVDRRFVVLTFNAADQIVGAVPSGFTDEPNPSPVLEEIMVLLHDPGSIRTVGSADGSISYRALAIADADGGSTVVAVPIDDITAAANDLVWPLLIGGISVAVVGAAATWLLVRSSLRPIDAMVETAEAIASGDLSRRVPNQNVATELGQLGDALNVMLSQVDAAFVKERAAQLQLNQFIADASHELRTPLAAVQGYSELYRKGALEDPIELDAAMARIRRESGRMQRLVDDLLLLARLDQGQTLEVAEVDVVPIISDSIADSRAIEPERMVTYTGPARALVSGDANRLAQVFANLMANTRVHTPAAAAVEITVTAHAEEVQIAVADSGSGIPDVYLDQVFDRFNRGDVAQAANSSGSGLGLAIVAAIVEAHRGSVKASNQPEGGACFTVTLPTVVSS